MGRTSILCVALVVWASGVPGRAQPISDEVRIYDLALRAALGSTSARLALVSATSDLGAFWRQFEDPPLNQGPNCIHPRCRITDVKPETVEAFLVASAASKPVPRELAALKEFTLVDAAEFKKVEARSNWDATVTVSGIGFDSARTQALVYVDYVCGSLCGQSVFVIAERSSAGWRVVKVQGFMVY